MRLYQGLLFLLLLSCCAFAQDKPLADRLAGQNALFDEQYESDLRNFPTRATAYGDYRYNDKLGDRSAESILAGAAKGIGALNWTRMWYRPGRRNPKALDARRNDPSPLVREHVAWALREQDRKRIAADSGNAPA